MLCKKCGHLLDPGEKFCPQCGNSVEPDLTDAVETEILEEETSEGKQENKFVAAVKDISLTYVHALKSAILRPYQTSKEVTEVEKINGFITLVLFSILLPLQMFMHLRQLSWRPPGFLDMYVIPIFITLAMFAVFIGVVLAVAKLMKIEQISFFLVTAKLGVLMILPTAALLIAVIFTLVTAYGVSMLFFSIALMLATITALVVVFSVTSDSSAGETGIDIYYANVIVYVAMVLVLLLIGDRVYQGILEIIGGGMFSPF